MNINEALFALKHSLCNELDVAALVSRNPTAHKWKTPWRSLLLREVIAWRIQDLLEQSQLLNNNSGTLGARILLRSAFETLAVLIYLNQCMRQVVAGNLDFHAFSEKTTMLVLGSRDKSTRVETINILTVLGKAELRYHGLEEWYAALSESAHPNHEGMVMGYSTNDTSNSVTTFKNRWNSTYGKSHPEAIKACLLVFEHEYNDEWPDAFEALEQWMVANDARLEATKPVAQPG